MMKRKVRIVKRMDMYIPQEKFLFWWVDSRSSTTADNGFSFSYPVEYNSINDAMRHLNAKFSNPKRDEKVVWEDEL